MPRRGRNIGPADYTAMQAFKAEQALAEQKAIDNELKAAVTAGLTASNGTGYVTRKEYDQLAVKLETLADKHNLLMNFVLGEDVWGAIKLLQAMYEDESAEGEPVAV